MRAALEQFLARKLAWLPMDEAPKDGKPLLLRVDGAATISKWHVHYMNGKPDARRKPEWYQRDMFGGFGGYEGPLVPTGWLPLPPTGETT
jgi:hypothetical protein